MRPSRTRLGIAFALVAAALFLSVPDPARAEVDVRTIDPPKPVAEFALADHKKNPFGPEQLKDQWSLLLLGYTHCPDVCPFTLNNLALVVEQLKSQMTPGSLPKVYFIGVDPDRDADVLADYVPHFDPDFLGATGAWDEVKKLVEALDGFVRLDKKKPNDEGYLVRHSSRVSVIDPKGRIIAQINPPMPPAETAMLIASLIRKHRKNAALDHEQGTAQ